MPTTCIKLSTCPTDKALPGQSKWWGEPDMPETLEYPEILVTDEDEETYDDPLTFICQIRLSDIAPFDAEGHLPHEGMLWFFAALDYFLGDTDAPSYPGMGEWKPEYFRVYFSSDCHELHTHHITYPDGTSATMPAEAITFAKKPASLSDEATCLLGQPYLEEVREAMPGMLSLLQVDECDRWGLTFHDCGMLNFLISPEDLAARRFDRVKCYLHSF